jgi:isopenicillin-N N-acyltransferase like protein
MLYPKPPILELDSTNPRRCGQIHGESLRDKIRAMAQIRLELMCTDAGFASQKDVLEIASAHLPILKDFDEDLYLEVLGISEGSRLTPEEIVVLNHYTDMRDLHPSHLSREDDDTNGCSVIYTKAPKGPLLGQTWDIDSSAVDHVVILKITNQETDVLLFSIAGCIGMTGMNNSSVGICINNLSSIDAKIGIVWPALVRKVLKQKSAKQGCDLILQASLGSGHHYCVADTHDFFGIETSGTKKKITQRGSNKTHFHTNHCLDAEMQLTHTVKSTSTTYSRYQELEKRLACTLISSINDIYELLGRVSTAPKPRNHAVATCGALVMDLRKKTALACMGPPSQEIFNNPPLYLSLARCP